LVRDPKKRATVAQLWDEEWMDGEGGMSRPGEGYRIYTADDDEAAANTNAGESEISQDTLDAPLDSGDGEPFEDGMPEGEDVEPDPHSGLLVDGGSISDVARLDVN